MSILWLEEAATQNVDLVGGKAANLARLAATYQVPPGFVVTNPLVNPAALLAAYHELGARLGEAEPSVAVRSSAVDEDGADASFAGQHETYLNVTGAEAVAAAIARCWRSAHAERALDYRRRNGLSTQQIRLAVLVQALVPADVAGVVFSANPINRRRNEAVVTASWGLGESVVGGTVTPDTFVVKTDRTLRQTERILSRQIADKQWMTIATPDGTQEVKVPSMLRALPSLSDEETLAMAQLALDLQATMGYPVDIECAYAGGKLYLLQCRPITTLANAGHRTFPPMGEVATPTLWQREQSAATLRA